MPIFLHLGWVHYICNLIAEIQCCYIIEHLIGTWNFAFAYFVSNLGGLLLSGYRHPYTISVGASASIFGIIGIFLIYCIKYYK